MADKSGGNAFYLNGTTMRQHIQQVLLCLSLVACFASAGCSKKATVAGDACAKVVCPRGSTCDAGQCVADETPPTRNDEAKCNRQNATGACGEGESCVDGICFSSGATPTACASGVNGRCDGSKACVGGSCVDIAPVDACGASTPDGLCPGGQRCVQGYCFNDVNLSCSATNTAGVCPSNQVCSAGSCTSATFTCDASVPDGTCPSWQACREGQCVGPISPDACSASNQTGICPATDVCVAGNCTPLTNENGCSAGRPLGLCPTGAACLNGACVNVTDANACSAAQPNGVCAAGGVCRNGECVLTSCANGGALCSSGQICTGFECTAAVCSPIAPTGLCTDVLAACVQGVCVGPECRDTDTVNHCAPDFFCQNNACTPVTCSPSNKTGVCPPGQGCINGACQVAGCSTRADPDGYCAPLVCDVGLDLCVQGSCAPSRPDGVCSIGQACIGGVCSIPYCAEQFPGGRCPVGCEDPDLPGGAPACGGFICGGAAGCIEPPCGVNNLDGDCPDGRVCCATAAGIPGEYGACVQGQCTRKACDFNNQSGYCPVGQACLDNTGVADPLPNSYTCQIPTCSSQFPVATCDGVVGGGEVACDGAPNGTCVCEEGVCRVRCGGTVNGGCSPGFDCVGDVGSFACLPSCTVNGVVDADCDRISDLDEGLVSNVDSDGDGVVDGLDSDSDNDGIPDAIEAGRANSSLPVRDSDGDGIGDFREVDADNDFISDAVEAQTPTSPIDSDGDGLPNNADTDSDNDGISDRCEATLAACSNNTLITTGNLASLANIDGDSLPDYLDRDSDGDGISDAIESRTRPSHPATSQTTGVDSDNDTVPDHRDLDSDNDGIADAEEDLNANGIVDCQLDGLGQPVPDTRAPACNANYTSSSIVYAYDYNAGCNANGIKCVLAEGSRVHPDTDGDSIADNNDGVFKVCATQNLKPINVFYSQPADFAFALEQNYGRAFKLFKGGEEIGLSFDDLNTNAANINGSNAVSGFIFTKPPAAQAIAATGTPSRLLIEKAIVQESQDRAAIDAIANTTVNVILTRNATTFDGFGVVFTRYRVRLSSGSASVGGFRDSILTALVAPTAGFAQDNGPTGVTDFTVTTQTLYRLDANTPGGSAPGAVLIIGAVAPTATTNTVGYEYRTRCSTLNGNQASCDARQGCAWQATGSLCQERGDRFRDVCAANTSENSCTSVAQCLWRPIAGVCEANDYQIPVFFADNISNGSSVTQYGDDLAALCQTFSQKNPILDFVWTTDDSGSMNDEITNIGGTANQFFQLIHTTEADYRIAQTTSSSSVNNRFPVEFDFSFQSIRNTQTGRDGVFSGEFTGAIAGAINPSATDRSVGYTCADGCDFVKVLCTTRTDAAGCNNASYDATCDWTGSACLDKCTIAGSNQASCEANSFCQFANNTCVAKCCQECGTGVTSVNSPSCYFASRLPNNIGTGAENKLIMTEWSLYRAGAMDHCNGLNELSCATSSGCTWSTASNVCLVAGCSEQTTALSCEGHDICLSPRRADQTRCNATSGCTWVGGSCRNSRMAPHCRAFTTSGTCTPVAGCSWVNNYCTETVCRGPCAAYGDSASCNGEPTDTCTWQSALTGNDRCQLKSGNCQSASSHCVAHDPSGSNNTQCRSIDTEKHYDSPAPASCEWNYGTSECVPSVATPCNTYDQASCPAGRCSWNATVSACTPVLTKARTLCDVGTGSQADCEALPYFSGTAANGAKFCVWDTAFAPGGSCHPTLKRAIRPGATVTAIIVTDEDDCYVKDGGSGRYDGDCQNGRLDFDPTTFSGSIRQVRTNAYSQFAAARDVSVYAIAGDKSFQASGGGGCNDAGTGNGAEASQADVVVSENTGGGWGSICPPERYPIIESIILGALGKASEYKLESFIDGRAVQPISSTIKVAVEVCNVPAQYPHCRTNDPVTPGSGTRIEVVPRSRESGFDYDATNNTLTLYGANRPASGGDIVVSYRYWVDNEQEPGGEVCSGLCPGPNGDCLCPSGTQCGVQSSCDALTTSGACNAAAGCAWRTAAGVCATGSVCSSYGSEGTCTAGGVFGCSWNGSACVNSTLSCASYLTQGTCDAPSVVGCEWNGTTCVADDSCAKTTQATCDNTAGCAWNVTTNACVVSTVCEVDPTCGGGCGVGQQCNGQTGVCECVTPCSSGCGPLEYCDTSDAAQCGVCTCRSDCGGDCGSGRTCADHDSNAATCNQCVCDTTCGGVQCPGQSTCETDTGAAECGLCVPPKCGFCPDTLVCDPGSGFCVCDTSCGGGCPNGTMCDANPGSQTCGQCQCIEDCGGSCPNGTVCSDPASATCGLCIPPPQCPVCAQGQVCDPINGICVVDPDCGGCVAGFQCNPVTGQCQPGVCPAIVTDPSNCSNATTEGACTLGAAACVWNGSACLVDTTRCDDAGDNCCAPGNYACCYGPEGSSPFDRDYDGYIDCASECGRVTNSCGVAPCDADDTNPLVH